MKNLNTHKANLISPSNGRYTQLLILRECIPIPIKTSPIGELSKEIYYGVTTT
jgi:hypothetical protein